MLKNYRPIASQGFRFSDAYMERLPCAALRPYVHCFWGTTGALPRFADAGLVIPDTCMDIIFEINYTTNQISGVFCALDDTAYYTEPNHTGDLCAIFGIRFFAWSAVGFSQDGLLASRSMVFRPEALFPDICRELIPRLFDLDTLERRAGFAEDVLLRHMKPERICPDTLNALDAIIQKRGTIRLPALAASACMSQRQLERLFYRDLGASPKLVTQLIRHQMIYREILEGRFLPADAVERYGYADQSHLIRDFRRFHIFSPSEIAAAFNK